MAANLNTATSKSAYSQFDDPKYISKTLTIYDQNIKEAAEKCDITYKEAINQLLGYTNNQIWVYKLLLKNGV